MTDRELSPELRVLSARWFLWEGLRIAEERADANGQPGAVVKRFYS